MPSQKPGNKPRYPGNKPQHIQLIAGLKISAFRLDGPGKRGYIDGVGAPTK
jgi:hypothetical protein